MLIGETVRFMIGEDEFEGIVESCSNYDYFGDGKGHIYKIRTKRGTVKNVSETIENIFGFALEEN